MIRSKKTYLTDITTSEGNLSRLSLICQVLATSRTRKSNELFRIIEQEIRLTNYRVIGRHLHILAVLGLTARTPETYLITSRGKALVRLRRKESNLLGTTEKVLFFKCFFRSLPDQLYWVIYTIGKKKGSEVAECAKDYFYNSPARAIWGRTIETAIRREVDRAPLTRGMENKFETMLCWLSQLDIIGKANTIWLTEKGKKLLSISPMNFGELSTKIYYYATQLYGEGSPRHFDLNYHRRELIDILREGSQLFRGEQNLSDLAAIQEFASAVFASGGIILEEETFYRVIEQLGLDGTIKSIILGRDGRPAFLIMD